MIRLPSMLKASALQLHPLHLSITCLLTQQLPPLHSDAAVVANAAIGEATISTAAIGNVPRPPLVATFIRDKGLNYSDPNDVSYRYFDAPSSAFCFDMNF